MIEWSERINEFIEHPIISTTVGATVATAGALTKFDEDQSIIRGILSDGCLLVGILTSFVGLLVMVRNYRIKTTQEKMENIKLQAMMRKERREGEDGKY